MLVLLLVLAMGGGWLLLVLAMGGGWLLLVLLLLLLLVWLATQAC